MNLGTASVIRANSRHLPLDDDSVDLVVTSPPRTDTDYANAWRGGWRRDGLILVPTGVTAEMRFGDVIREQLRAEREAS